MSFQFERTKLGDTESGMYDPHVGGARTAKTQAPRQFVTVVSTSIVGPVLLAEDAATLILKALARGGFSCAVKLRDVLDSVSPRHFSLVDIASNAFLSNGRHVYQLPTVAMLRSRTTKRDRVIKEVVIPPARNQRACLLPLVVITAAVRSRKGQCLWNGIL